MYLKAHNSVPLLLRFLSDSARFNGLAGVDEKARLVVRLGLTEKFHRTDTLLLHTILNLLNFDTSV